MSVLIDAKTLLEGVHEHSVIDCGLGIDLPVETLRRMACYAEITPIIVGADGVHLHLGRTTRLASREQRRALRAMYRGCAIPGCCVAWDYVVIHHLKWFRNLGTTDIDNLLPLCTKHHHLAHEGRWQLTLDTTTQPHHHQTRRHPNDHRPTNSPRRMSAISRQTQIAEGYECLVQGCDMNRSTSAATALPSRAQRSAADTRCTRLPIAKTPSRLVRNVLSTSGPLIIGFIVRPLVRANSLSGIQHPVNTIVSHSIVRPSVKTTCSTRRRPTISAMSTPVRIGNTVQGRGRQLQHAVGLVAGERGHHRYRLAADMAQGEDRREADVLGADDHGTVSDALTRHRQLLQRTRREDSSGPIAGHETCRLGVAPRPVANRTASASTSSSENTGVPRRMSTPARAARSANVRA